MTPYTDEWNKWRGLRRKALNIEKSKKRVEDKRALFVPFVARDGDNFRFVWWGGFQELKLWSWLRGLQ
jgi:hypothetical protein